MIDSTIKSLSRMSASVPAILLLFVVAPFASAFSVPDQDVQGSHDYPAHSQRSAEAVVAALVKDYHIAPARLVAKGLASYAPVASNADDAGRARNRRVELVLQ